MEAELKVDLSGLTEFERVPLRLLVRGHTIKSIASSTQQSETTVNERLRRARKKTGIASSRELARILAAQENWDHENGAVRPAQTPPEEAAKPHTAWLWFGVQGVSLMVIALLIAATLWQGLSAAPSAQSREAASDQLVGPLVIEQAPNFAGLHAQVRSETRADVWAAETERALMDLYGSKGATAGTKSNVRVVCASTLCEVAGQFSGPMRQISKAYQTLQAPALRTGEAKLGLDFVGTNFGKNPSSGDQFEFLTYLTRRSHRP